jgi:uncharacterized membrane protein (UPF0127 family)
MGLLFLSGCSGEKRQVPTLQQDPVLEFVAEVIFYDDAQQEITRIDAAVADDDRERAAGLMNVRSMQDDQGMIFLFEQEQPRSFWMMNTFLSLDIVYVNAAMEIVRIHRYTTPFSQEGILSEKPAKYVVEVKAGFTVVHDINEGDSISFSIRDQG